MGYGAGKSLAVRSNPVQHMSSLPVIGTMHSASESIVGRSWLYIELPDLQPTNADVEEVYPQCQGLVLGV